MVPNYILGWLQSTVDVGSGKHGVEGTGALLAAPRGIVQKLNKGEWNTAGFHNQLDVYSTLVLFVTTPQNHGSIVQKLQEEFGISSLNAR